MKINHVAIWVLDIEKSREFYEKYFGGISNEKYENKLKGFSSYFLSFESGTRLEIMQKVNITKFSESSEKIGIAHIAFSVGSKDKVNELTERLRKDGYKIIGEPRVTGDGYYESVICDENGILIEITE